MLVVPWKYIAGWKCTACGECCKAYSVVISFQEWLKIVRNYGVEKTVSDLNKLFIKRSNDGSCAFLCNLFDMHLCGLQHMKPKACKLWPFKVLSKPEFGDINEAVYNYGGNELFVYADSTCKGLRYGNPTWDFTGQTLREFVEIASGIRTDQYKSTGNLVFTQPYTQPKRFRLP